MSTDVQRKLTTILSADAEGYSREMQIDEVRTLGALKAAREVFSKFIERHHGRIANTAGDGLIAEFPSVVEAVQCAIEVQQELGSQNNDPKGVLRFRIGIHLGDVMVDGDDLLGEGVNLAARLQTMADAGSILVSQQVYDQVYAKLSVGFEYLGEKRPKNFSEDVPVYGVLSGKEKRLSGKDKHRRPKVRPSTAPVSKASDIEEMRAPAFRLAALAGVFWVALLIIDLVTGPPLWAHFPGIVLATVLLLYSAPLIIRNTADLLIFRGAVIAIALLLINLATWSGYLWAMWPMGAIILITIARRLSVWKL